MGRYFKAMLDLGRVANLPTVCSNVLAAWLVSTAGFPDLLPASARVLPALLLGACLLYTAGTTLNDACDVAFDRQYRPERPIPSGLFTAAQVWTLGLGQMAVGAVLLVFAGVAWHLILALVVLILAYDFVHKRWAGSVWLMGLCRSCLWLMPASLPGHVRDSVIVVFAGAVGLYIVALSLTARSESRVEASPSRWPPLLLQAPLIGFLWGWAWRDEAPYWGLVFPLLFLYVVRGILNRMRRNPPASIGAAVALALAAIPLVDALALAPSRPWVALLIALGLPLTLLLQRYITST